MIFLQEAIHITNTSFQETGEIDGDVLIFFQYGNGAFQQRVSYMAHDELYIGMTDSRFIQRKGMTVF